MSQKANESQNQPKTRDERIAALIAAENVSFKDEDKDILANLSDEAFERVETVAFEQAEKLAEAEKGKDEQSSTQSASSAAANAETATASSESTSADSTSATSTTDSTHSDTEDADSTEDTKRAAEAPKVVPKAEKKVVPKTPEEYIAALEAPAQIKRIFQRHIEAEKEHRANLMSAIKANESNRLTDAALTAMDTEQLEAIAELAQPEADFSASGVHTHERQVRSHESGEEPEPLRMPSFGIKLGEARMGSRLTAEK